MILFHAVCCITCLGSSGIWHADEDEGSGGDESSDEEERPAKKQKKSKKGTKKGTNGAGNKGKGGCASGTFFSGLL